MRTFKVDDRIEIVCQAESTRSGFRHLAYLMIDGAELDKAKCTYQNRTWERFEYQSVLRALVDKTKVLNEAEKELARTKLDLKRASTHKA